MDRPWDVAVVGAGILGLATAREILLRRPSARVLVLEREREIAAHQTSHNSGVVHAGIYYAPGSLKAALCVEGREKLYAYCDEHGIGYEKCGKLIIARDPTEFAALDELERRGLENGVPGLRRLTRSEIAEIEPSADGAAALHSPETGIIDFAAVARFLAAEIQGLGATIQTGVTVSRLDRAGGSTILETSAGPIPATRAVACAGLWSDRLAVASGEPDDVRIVPFRGSYLKLRPHARGFVRGLIYPVPDPSLPFLGVHLTKTSSGDVWLGPTALLAPSRRAYSLRSFDLEDTRSTLSWPGTWRMARKFWRTGLTEMSFAARRRAFVEACAAYVPRLTVDDVEPGPAGIRAQAIARDGRLLDDFAFAETAGALHVRNAPSPAATSSLAIARVIADRLDAL
ncbi:L-2-hydroxyglutarate oxidase [Solirubrobacter ginsenosidimutans]|uniref:L-2-hydroxyglutarate oxidase n=1 Tax=Solirubrobacter ginsenosidimutans TaxID=490573 RepID=A0A9X3S133_9ACTN|nr:L-2-hydroxyglutarate oxidase [Solirubrobacter ginsenosidimutans]MDA0160667.1 L-2-hydroxyglutarate oxidase [Solirubrobacter ginsenosidimutans]